MAPSRRGLGIGGVLPIVAARQGLSLHATVNLIGVRNTEEIEPSPRPVRVTQVAGLAVVLFALWGPEEPRDAIAEDDDTNGIDFG